MGWNAADLTDQTGRRVIVTGANSGIGYVAARELSRRGADVVLACRDEAKAAEARSRIVAQIPDASVRVGRLDLASLDSVRAFAASESEPIDLLINNAGVMAPPRRRFTVDGFERQFGTNHLGHFALTGLLLPRLLAGREPRVVTVSSLSHRSGTRQVLDGNRTGRYSPSRTYSNSKLANLLFARELHRRGHAHGLISVAAHPGLASTHLAGSKDGMGAIPVIGWLASPSMRLIGQSADAGALPLLYGAAVAEPGAYVGPQRLRETRGSPGPARSSALAEEPGVAAALWELSERLTDVHYPWP